MTGGLLLVTEGRWYQWWYHGDRTVSVLLLGKNVPDYQVTRAAEFKLSGDTLNSLNLNLRI